MYSYYFALASQHFLINEEPLEEILRERTEYYKSIKKDIDFWFVINPNFINPSDIEGFNTRLFNSSAAVISSDKYFIQWLKLRIGFISIGSFQSDSIFINST